MAIKKVLTSIYETTSRSTSMGHYTTSTYKYPGVMASMQFYGASDFTVDLDEKLTEIWVGYHFYASSGFFAQSSPAIKFFDTDDSKTIPVVGWQFNTSSPWATKFQYWNGSSYTDFGEAVGALGDYGELYRVDLHVKIDDSVGVLEVYVDGVLGFTFTGDTKLTTGEAIDSIKFSFGGSGNAPWMSAVIIADESTLGMLAKQVVPIAAGGASDWSGAYTDINMLTNTPTSIFTGIPDNVSTFAKTSMEDYDTGYDVVSLIFNITGSIGKDTVGIKPVIRLDGINYDAGDIFDFTSSPNPKQVEIPLNPATEAAWVYSTIEAAEIGVKLVGVTP